MRTHSKLFHPDVVRAALLLLFLPCAAPSLETSNSARRWAEPVVSRHLKNFFRLDANLYRSAQMSRQGFQEMERRGITEVINLRDDHSDASLAAGLNMKLHHIKTEADDITIDQIVEALKIIRGAKGPVLVHCWHGADRTGAVCASYRIVFNGWSKQEAIEELRKGGFGFHEVFSNIIRLILEMDVQDVKKRVFAAR